jgi:hypothetical protein
MSQQAIELTRDKVVTDYETRMAVVGPDGAIDFHFTNAVVDVCGGRIGGVEIHRREPADYQKADEPDHLDCQLLHGKCWHDGSSLYATEVAIPYYEANGEEAMWLWIEREYRERFHPPSPAGTQGET